MSEKFWLVYGVKNDGRLEKFDTLDKAEIAAKRAVAKDNCDCYILESVAVARQPVPAIEVTKL